MSIEKLVLGIFGLGGLASLGFWHYMNIRRRLKSLEAKDKLAKKYREVELETRNLSNDELKRSLESALKRPRDS